MRSIKIKAPASVANLVCGYDVIGMCLHEPYDIMELKLIDEKKVIIHSSKGFELPTDPAKNTAGAPLLEILKCIDDNIGFELTITKNIKPGSGLGSSAASASGAAVAANMLLGNRFSKVQLVEFAMCGEEIASGVKHADNVAPVVYGGITLIRSLNPLDIVSIPSLPLFVTVVHPQIEIKTSEARKILPKEVPLKDAVKQWANVGALVAGLLKIDYGLIGRSLEDVLVEPVRSKLIPGYEAVKQGCKEVGVLGGGISGSGPSLFMLSVDRETAVKAEGVMKRVYQELGIDHRTYVTTANNDGCTIINN